MEMSSKILTIGLAVGGISFLIYRIVDLLQIWYTHKAPRPTDLEKIDDKIYEDKRQRKLGRTWKHVLKSGGSWGLQAGYVVLAFPLLTNLMLSTYKLSPGTTYTVLMVLGYVVNLTLSRLFSLWTPSLPFIGFYKGKHILGAAHKQPSWRPANMLWQGWGFASWAVPAYYMSQSLGLYGWVGSVAFLFIGQILQLIFFIFTIKQRAIPYQKYEGLSDKFKQSLHKYLESQGFQDHEVGVVKGMNVGPNAFATSFTSHYRQIIMTEELIKGFKDPQNPNFTFKLSEDTLEAIIAHEIGHAKNSHVEKSMFVGSLASALTTVAVYYIFTSLKTDALSLFNEGQANSQIMLLYGQSLFNVILTYPLTFFMIGMIRGNEYEADTHLLETNGCKPGDDFFHQIRHIAPVPNHPVWDRLNSTHPAPQDREERIKKWRKEHCK